LLSNVKKSNYTIPTPVQKYAIPTILKKRDLMACAQTGSGKTAAYVLPIMTNILADGIQSSAFSSIQEPQALILSPTRELASQIFSECKKFSYGSIIKSAILYGGVDTGFQLANLAKGCNILVATPGRLLDILEKQKISLAKVKYFVLDEADRMLDMGFEKTVREILTKGTIQAKGDRVTLMFSATFPEEIQKLAQDFLNDYLFLTVGIVGGANSDVQQILHKVGRNDKRNKVVEILNDIGTDKVMIFIEHKKQADILAFYLIQKGYPTTSLHGDRLQSQRELALKEFKNGKSNIIVCTSVAARGLDIEKVNHVINYDLPQTIDEYVHRIGRTGRCGNPGKAISFFDSESDNDTKLSRQLARILSQAKQQVPDWLSDTAADSIGTTFTGNDCTEDLRGKMSSLNVKVAIAPPDEEEW
jgi:probable ATP-dependent RNA helicase DDX4